MIGTQFTITVMGGKASNSATLVVSRGFDSTLVATQPHGDFANIAFAFDSQGHASVDLPLAADPALAGTVLTGRVYGDEGSATEAFQITLFGSRSRGIFASDFE